MLHGVTWNGVIYSTPQYGLSLLFSLPPFPLILLSSILSPHSSSSLLPPHSSSPPPTSHPTPPGQFWNIPISVEPYTGVTRDGSTNVYIVTVTPPNGEQRAFPAWREDQVCDTSLSTLHPPLPPYPFLSLFPLYHLSSHILLLFLLHLFLLKSILPHAGNK